MSSSITSTDTTAQQVVAKHPVRGAIWGLLLGIGLAMYAILFAIIPFTDWVPLILVVLAGVAIGVAWAYLAPAKKPGAPPPATSAPAEPVPSEPAESAASEPAPPPPAEPVASEPAPPPPADPAPPEPAPPPPADPGAGPTPGAEPGDTTSVDPSDDPR